MYIKGSAHLAILMRGSQEKLSKFRKLVNVKSISIRIRIRIFIVHKEAKFDLWDQSIHVFFICVSFLRRGIHTLKHKVSMYE